MSTLDKAINMATVAHFTKKDKAGKSYILHPLRVMNGLRTNDEELMCIAILHDAVEDSELTFELLYEEGFSDRVVNALKLLTHVKGISYKDYIEGMADNLDALLVKREDLKDNSDITRLKGLTDKDFERMKKYQKAFVRINEMINAHNNITTATLNH